MSDKRKLSPVQCIKEFFEGNGGKKVGMEELKALPVEDRKALGIMAADALGVECDIKP